MKSVIKSSFQKYELNFNMFYTPQAEASSESVHLKTYEPIKNSYSKRCQAVLLK